MITLSYRGLQITEVRDVKAKPEKKNSSYRGYNNKVEYFLVQSLCLE